jgi:hypothetical protein
MPSNPWVGRHSRPSILLTYYTTYCNVVLHRYLQRCARWAAAAAAAAARTGASRCSLGFFAVLFDLSAAAAAAEAAAEPLLAAAVAAAAAALLPVAAAAAAAAAAPSRAPVAAAAAAAAAFPLAAAVAAAAAADSLLLDAAAAATRRHDQPCAHQIKPIRRRRVRTRPKRRARRGTPGPVPPGRAASAG